MDSQSILGLLKALEDVRKRPGVWMSDEYLPVIAFIEGFNLASRSTGIPAGRDTVYDQILTERGWLPRPSGVWNEMRNRGLDDQAITFEILTIEIEALKRRYGIDDSKFSHESVDPNA